MALISGTSFNQDTGQRMIAGGLHGYYEPQSVGIAASIALECPDPNGFFKDVIVSTSGNRIVASIHNKTNPKESYLAFYDPLTLQPVGVGTTSVSNSHVIRELSFDNYRQYLRQSLVTSQAGTMVGTYNPVAYGDNIIALCHDNNGGTGVGHTQGTVYIAFFDLDGNLKTVWRPKANGSVIDWQDSEGVDRTSKPRRTNIITTRGYYGSVKMIAADGFIAIGRTADQTYNYENGYTNGTEPTYSGDGIFIFKFYYPHDDHGPHFVNVIPPVKNTHTDRWPHKMVMNGKFIASTGKGGASDGPTAGKEYFRIHDIHGNLLHHQGDDYNNQYIDNLDPDSTTPSYYNAYTITDPFYTQYYNNENLIEVAWYTSRPYTEIGGIAIAGNRVYVGCPSELDNRGFVEILEYEGSGYSQRQRYFSQTKAARSFGYNSYERIILNEGTFATSGDYMGRDLHAGSGRLIWGSPVAQSKIWDSGYLTSTGLQNSGNVQIISTDVTNDGDDMRYSPFANGVLQYGISEKQQYGLMSELRNADAYWTVKDIRNGVIVLATEPPLGSTSPSLLKVLRTPDSVHVLDVLEQK